MLTCDELGAMLCDKCGYICDVVCADEAPQMVTYHINRLEMLSSAKRKRAIETLEEELHTGTKSIALVESEKAHFALAVPRTDRATNMFADISNGEYGPTVAALGISTTGDVTTVDIRTAPHLLIAGQTGGGKSVLLSNVILSIAQNASPEEVRFTFIDPKRVELSRFAALPHCERICYTPRDASLALCNAVEEMERRYRILNTLGIQDVYSLKAEFRKQYPAIIIVVDEFANLMQQSKEASDFVEGKINRLTAEGRAAGIHVVLATQRPTTDVIRGSIKANIPCRIALKTVTHHDSKVILDETGAERLLGKGDAVIRRADGTKTRFQAALSTTDDIERLVQQYDS